MRRSLLAAALCAALAAPALANDTTAELAAGGLVLTRTDAIEMVSEDLYVSVQAIKVKYSFLNTSGKDVTTRVAFPMPDVGGPGYGYRNTSIPNGANPTNLLDFKTLIDGKPVKMDVEQKAFVGGVDYSAWLTKRGVPLAVYLEATGPKLDALSKADRAEAVRLGLAELEEYDNGKGMEEHLMPAWTVKTTFHWEQTFPAGRALAVEHSYTPAAGQSAGTIIGAQGFTGYEDWPATRDRYCIDTAFLAAAKKVQGKLDYPPFNEARVAYVLKTGGNWAKPIGDFRMVIDKGAPANLVSFCAEGVKKIGPTRFEVRKTNWTPTRDLDVLILVPLPPVE